MSFILTALTSKLAGPIAAGVAVLLAIALVASSFHSHRQKVQIASLTAERNAAQRDLGTCRANTTTLQSALTSQNAAVAAMVKAGDTSTAAANLALAQAHNATLTAEQRAGAILAAKPGPSGCTAALALIKGHLP